MRKLCALLVAVAMVAAIFGVAAPAMAVKPDWNLAAAQKVDWNLSGAVMPVPPYGSMDIPGSDIASKLIVNQPNGATEVAMTGEMKGLLPNTLYTVYLSKAYTPYEETGWNVSGSYTIHLTVGATPYTEYLVLTQTGTDITGTYLALDAAGTVSRWNIDTGSVAGNTLTFTAHYQSNLTMQATFTATIAADGKLVDGTWHDVGWNTRSGIWYSTAGAAVMTHTGSTGWPGLFTSTVQPFTFMTDEFGDGCWHLNLRDENFPSYGAFDLSVWVNAGGKTILISDVFTVVK